MVPHQRGLEEVLSKTNHDSAQATVNCVWMPLDFVCFVLFWVRVSGSPGWPLIHYIVEANLDLLSPHLSSEQNSSHLHQINCAFDYETLSCSCWRLVFPERRRIPWDSSCSSQPLVHNSALIISDLRVSGCAKVYGMEKVNWGATPSMTLLGGLLHLTLATDQGDLHHLGTGQVLNIAKALFKIY